MQGTLVDITERIEIEARLHQEQEFVRRLVASFPDMIAVMDFEGRFTFVSPRVEDILGIRHTNWSASSSASKFTAMKCRSCAKLSPS